MPSLTVREYGKKKAIELAKIAAPKIITRRKVNILLATFSSSAPDLDISLVKTV